MKATTNFALPYPEPADNSQTWTYWQGLAEAVDAIVPKVATSTAAMVINNAANGSSAVTWPAGLFTDVPVAVGNMQGGSIYIVNVNGVTTTGGTIVARYYLGTARTETINVGCVATQVVTAAVETTSLATRAADADTIDIDGVTYTLRTVVCQTDGCANKGAACQVYLADDTSCSCGVCGNAITDIT